MKKIICVHLLNDYSESPLTLSESVKGFIEAGYSVELFTNKNSRGFLSGIAGVNYNYFTYRWFKNKWLMLAYLMLNQTILFFKFFRYYNQDVTIYVNTILPFGPALAGKFMKKKVVFHIHETSVKPAIFKKFLLTVVKYAASKIIYVSEYLKKKEEIANKGLIVRNALSEEFVCRAMYHINKNDNFENVLMFCSLNECKGVNEFIKLSAMLPNYKFTLVLNSDQKSINEYMKRFTIPANLFIYSAQKDVHSFYQNTDLVLNLSHPDKWIETFEMTVLEAMSYGLPVIVPPVGGIAELVTEGFNGFKSDVRNLEEIKQQIEKSFSNRSFYNYLSFNARKKSRDFNIQKFRKGVLSAVEAA